MTRDTLEFATAVLLGALLGAALALLARETGPGGRASGGLRERLRIGG